MQGILQKTPFAIKTEAKERLFVPEGKQISRWRKANRKMNWGIEENEFRQIKSPPQISGMDRAQGFKGVALFYGFGDDGAGNADAVMSGKLAWEYALRRRKGRIWQCEYVHLDEPDYRDYVRLRPGAQARPRGFYHAKFQVGEEFQSLTVSQVRKRLGADAACGPEGIQFLVVTHPHALDMMNERSLPFMALADYDVAPFGYEDFYDAPQVFCSNGILGLGIGHIDRNYPLFGIPTVRFQ